jgi:hypothetical protein
LLEKGLILKAVLGEKLYFLEVMVAVPLLVVCTETVGLAVCMEDNQLTAMAAKPPLSGEQVCLPLVVW